MNKLFAADIQRILVTRTDRIGDLVLSTPIFRALREEFPQAWITGLTFVQNRDILDGNPYLNEVILYDKKGSEKGFLGNLIFAGRLRKKKFDMVIHLHATHRMHWITWLAGIPIRIGWGRKSAQLLTHAYPDLKKEGKMHEAHYNFELLQDLGISTPDPVETYFPVSEKSRRSLAELLTHHKIPGDRPRLILNVSASCPSKIWPTERFGHLVDALAARHDAVFVGIGSREDRHLIQKVQKNSAQKIYDLSGKLTLSMLGALLQESALLISNDSGPVHIATAVGTPVISIFGRKQPGLSPARWRPLGENSRVVWKDVGCQVCLAHDCQIHFLCLDAVTVDDVMREVESLLSTESVQLS